MKTTFRMTVMAAALGMVSGLMAAQEQGATAGSEPVAATTATHVDNGAMPGDSHVRIVRLSDVKGSLALDRKTGLGFEQTMQNMPIVEGEKLKTEDGYAEVEFEDNTTMRLAPNSQVDFSLLALRSSGAKASTMNVVKGTVYVSTESTKGNEFLLVAGETKMTVAPSTHLRLQVNESRTVVSVFNGSVEVQRGGETTLVSKKESLTIGADQMTTSITTGASSMPAGRRSGSRISWARDGVLTRMACGRCIPGLAIRLCRRIRGDGCRITRARGRSSRDMDGVGSRAARGMD